MKKVLLPSLVAVMLLSGCGGAPSKVSIEKNKDIIHDLPSDGMAHVFVEQDTFYEPISIMVNSNIKTKIGYQSYAHFTLSPGVHWFSFEGKEKSEYICKKFQPNTNEFYKVDGAMGLIHPRYSIVGSSKEQLIERPQVFKNYDDVITSKQISFENFNVVGDGEILSVIKQELVNRLSDNKIKSGSDLTIKLSQLARDDGNRLARYFWGNSKEDKAYLVVKAELLVAGLKVDELTLAKELSGGLFGGSAEGLGMLIAADIENYALCKFSANK